jgi:hypothetical protein
MIDASKKYKTRDGRDVRIYAVDGSGGFPVHGAYVDDSGEWWLATWKDSGSFRHGDEHRYDLVEVKPRIKRTVWLNLYALHNGAWESKEVADKQANESRIACVKVDIDVEEGHGLQ